MVRDLFARHPSAGVVGLILWVPVLDDDSAGAASIQAQGWNDPRGCHWWDVDRRVSEVFRAALGLKGPAWDLYLLYRPGVMWESDAPPEPTFWMHQIPDDPGAGRAPLLDAARLGQELETLLPPPEQGGRPRAQ